MVGRDIEQRGAVRAAGGPEQLAVADLGDHCGVGVELWQLGEQALADVAADQRRASVRPQNFAHQRCGRGFAGAAGDADHGGGAAVEEDAHRPVDGHAAPCGGAKQRQIAGDALAGDDGVETVDKAEVVLSASARRDPQLGEFGLDRDGGTLIDDVHLANVFLLEELRGVAALDAEAQHGDAASGEAGRRRRGDGQGHEGTCNARATPRMPPAMPSSQKRVTICGSDQPPSSRWLWNGAMRKTRRPPLHL